ncbi:MAG: hypothetical protein WA175_01060 [Candidatus Acidiferrales bacterium]
MEKAAIDEDRNTFSLEYEIGLAYDPLRLAPPSSYSTLSQQCRKAFFRSPISE